MNTIGTPQRSIYDIARDIVQKEPIFELCTHEVLWLLARGVPELLAEWDGSYATFSIIPLMIIKAYEKFGGDALRGRTVTEFCWAFRHRKKFSQQRQKFGLREITTMKPERKKILKEILINEGLAAGYFEKNFPIYTFVANDIINTLKIIEEKERCFSITCAVCQGKGLKNKILATMAFIGYIAESNPTILAKAKKYYRKKFTELGSEEEFIDWLSASGLMQKVDSLSEYDDLIESTVEEVLEKVEEYEESQMEE